MVCYNNRWLSAVLIAKISMKAMKVNIRCA